MPESLRQRRLRSLSDDLAMWASQIREHCDDKKNALPNPDRMDDWLAEYKNEVKNDSSKGGQ